MDPQVAREVTIVFSYYSTMSTDTIRIETRYIARASPSQPAFVLQATCLAGSYMLWIGTAEDGGRGDDESAKRLVAQGSVARDWACAMPPIQVRRSRPHGRHGY